MTRRGRSGPPVEYRGHVITRAWAGHVNVTRAGGFCGGFPSMAAARRAIDQAAARPVFVRYVADGAYHVAHTVDRWHLTCPPVGPVRYRAGDR